MEDNGDLIDSTAWNAQVALAVRGRLEAEAVLPLCRLRRRQSQHAKNEAFDGLWTGFYDWGTWWQGEIAGEYFASNSNLITNQLRLQAKPSEAISTGLICSTSALDRLVQPGVTSKRPRHRTRLVHGLERQRELHRELRGRGGEPGNAVEQSYDRTDNFSYGMIFAAYNF